MGRAKTFAFSPSRLSVILSNAELLRELATKQFKRDRFQPGKLRKLFLDLLARNLPLLLISGTLVGPSAKMATGRAVRAARCRAWKLSASLCQYHIERCPQHDRAVLIEGTHFPHGLYIYRKPTFAQRRGNCSATSCVEPYSVADAIRTEADMVVSFRRTSTLIAERFFSFNTNHFRSSLLPLPRLPAPTRPWNRPDRSRSQSGLSAAP